MSKKKRISVLGDRDMKISTKAAIKENHGLPNQLENGRKLRIETYKDFEEQGVSRDEVDKWYDGHGDIVKMYSYVSEDGEEGERVGVEFADGRLAIYGCRADIDSCKSEQHFVDELTDLYWNGGED